MTIYIYTHSYRIKYKYINWDYSTFSVISFCSTNDTLYAERTMIFIFVIEYYCVQLNETFNLLVTERTERMKQAKILLHRRANCTSFLLNLQLLLLVQARGTFILYQSQMSGNDSGMSFFLVPGARLELRHSTFTARKVASNKLRVYPNESRSLPNRVRSIFISKSRQRSILIPH